VLSLSKINKYYRVGEHSLHVLRDVDLSIDAGEFCAVMGASGSGKSTLLNVLGILDTYESGEYTLDGTLIKNLSERQAAHYRNRFIGFVFQSFNLLPFKTAVENIALPLYYQGVPRRRRNAIALQYLERVGIKDWAEHRPAELSGGQKQRVCIARALAAKPSLIICDEVTSALDPLVANGILKLLLGLQSDENVAYLFITHDLATVKSIADSIAVMYRGEVVRYGSKSQVLTPPFDAYTDLLLSSVPEMELGWLEKAIKGRRMESAGN